MIFNKDVFKYNINLRDLLIIHDFTHKKFIHLFLFDAKYVNLFAKALINSFHCLVNNTTLQHQMLSYRFINVSLDTS